jgi:hypothetical protein
MSTSTSGVETCKHGKQAPKYVLRDIPESQGGIARHGCVVCAYEMGIEEGIRREKAAQARAAKAAEPSS